MHKIPDARYNPSEILLKLKYRKVSFAFKNCIRRIFLKYRTEYGIITAVLCVTFQNNAAINKEATDKRYFLQFELEVDFKQNVYIVMDAWASTL